MSLSHSRFHARIVHEALRAKRLSVGDTGKIVDFLRGGKEPPKRDWRVFAARAPKRLTRKEHPAYTHSGG